MKLSAIFVLLVFLIGIFGAYPKTIDIEGFETVIIEKRTLDCVEKEKGIFECPVLQLETRSRELSKLLSSVWCPFIPLSYEGLPVFDLVFKSNQGDKFELGVRGGELSNNCLLPSEAKKYLEKVISSNNTELTYEKL